MGVAADQHPRVYFATPKEIAERLDASAGGRGETILYENHTWGPKAAGKGTTDCIPDDWVASEQRLKYLFEKYGV